MHRFPFHIVWIIAANLLYGDFVRSQEKTPQPPLVVELLDAGSTPHRKLRFAPRPGTKQVTLMTMNMSQSMTIGGQAGPTQNIPVNKITMETTIDKLHDNGDISFKFAYTDVEVVDDPANPSPMTAIMKPLMQQLVGTSGDVMISNRGITKQAEIVVPEGVQPQMKQIIEGMKSALNQISSPVPEEALGLGGKWRVVQEISANGLQLKQTSIHEIVELRDDGFVVTVKLTQDAQPQEIKNAQLPPGAKVNLKTLASNGGGKSNLKFDSMLPVDASVGVSSQTAMAVEIAGQTQEMTTDTKMEMTLTPVK
jgi:hypothetical protein